MTNKVQHGGTEILRYSYDANHRLTNRWSKEKLDTQYRYNKDGTLTNINYASSPDIALVYDALGRLATMIDAAGTTSYTYSKANQVLTEDGPWNDDVVSYGYTNRLRASLSLAQPYGSAWQQSYGYDALKRLKDLGAPAGAFGYAYAGGSPAAASPLVRQINLPNGAYITNTYNAARLVGTVLRNSTSVSNSHEYEHDAYRRKKQTFATTNHIDYTYDNIGQLIAALGKHGSTNRLHEQLLYDYDASGNLEKRTNDVLVQTFGVNALNQLTTVSRTGNISVAGFTTTNATSVTVKDNSNSAVAATRYADNTFARANVPLLNGNNTFTAVATDASGRGDTNSVTVNLPTSVSYTYDDNGNLISDGLRTFDFDDENQLIRAAASDWETHFIYDGKMRKRVALHYKASTSATNDWVTGVTSLSSLLRNDIDTWVGTRIVVGATPLLVTDLGRWVVSGNSQSHSVRLAYADGTDVPGGSVTVNTAGAPTNQFKTVTLASPVTLAPYGTYFIVSREYASGDLWYSYDNVLTTTSAATIRNNAYAQVGNPNLFLNGSDNGYMWGPLNFRYKTDWLLASETRYIYDGMLPIQEQDGNNVPRVSYTRGLDLSGTFELNTPTIARGVPWLFDSALEQLLGYERSVEQSSPTSD